jgi:hypothetical protein
LRGVVVHRRATLTAGWRRAKMTRVNSRGTLTPPAPPSPRRRAEWCFRREICHGKQKPLPGPDGVAPRATLTPQCGTPPIRLSLRRLLLGGRGAHS